MSAVYPKAKEQLLAAGIDLTTATVKLQAVSSSYSYSTAHEFLSDVSAGYRLGTAVTLSGKTVTSGSFRCAAVSYTGVAAAAVVAGFVGYIDTGSAATSRLVWYANTSGDYTTISYTGDGAAIALTWPAGYVFTL